jgi:hypothetical protein
VICPPENAALDGWIIRDRVNGIQSECGVDILQQRDVML